MFAAGRNGGSISMMETLEKRTMMMVADDGLDGNLLGNLFGDSGGTTPPVITAPAFPSAVAADYLGQFNSPRSMTIKDTVGSDGDLTDVFRIKVNKRMKFAFDVTGNSLLADMELYDGNGTSMASNTFVSDGVQHIGKNLGRGSYYIAYFSNGTPTSYHLHIAATPAKK